jgi:alpha-mannosidase
MAGASKSLAPFVQVDQPNVIIETVKRAEHSRSTIVRLYESQRKRGWLTLQTGFDLAGAWRTNLLEEQQEALETQGRSVRLFIQPYQIVTLELTPAGSSFSSNSPLEVGIHELS